MDGHPNYLIWRCIRRLPHNDNASTCGLANINMIAEISMKSELINELKHVKGHQQRDETIQKLKEKPTNMYQITEDDGVCYIKNRTDDCWKLILPVTLI